MVVAVGARGGDNVAGGVTGAVGTAKGNTYTQKDTLQADALNSELYKIKVDHIHI